MLNLNKTWVTKQGDFFVESPIILFAAIIWFLRIYKEGKYCTFPHANKSYEKIFPILTSYPELENYLSPFMDAWMGGAADQLQGQIASAKIPLSRMISPQLYWDVGKRITEQQAALGWGQSVVETLSRDIQAEFPGITGFSARNMWDMARLYVEYQQDEFLRPLVAEISWSKHLVIMNKIKDTQERQFYILATKKFGWTKNVLIHKIELKTYEKYLLGQTNFETTLPESIRNQAVLALKDDYSFGFTGLDDGHSEYELEQAIVKNIRAFLMEFGGEFSFIGNQHRTAQPIGVATYSLSSTLPEAYKDLLPVSEEIAKKIEILTDM